MMRRSMVLMVRCLPEEKEERDSQNVTILAKISTVFWQWVKTLKYRKKMLDT